MDIGKGPEKTPNVEQYVRDYFKDIPVMAEIARCESRFRQWNKEGAVLRGVQNSADVGVMQINETYHLSKSRELGYNLNTLEGNVQYARFLYSTQGTRPWNWSRSCWGQQNS